MTGAPELERLIRAAAGIEADEGDVHRAHTFVDEKVDAMALAGRDAARANGRDVIAPQDLPITAGLRQQMRDFARMDAADELRRALHAVVRRPPGDVTFSPETEAALPEVFGGIGLALARSFRIIHPELRHPTVEHWSRVFEAYRLVL